MFVLLFVFVSISGICASRLFLYQQIQIPYKTLPRIYCIIHATINLTLPSLKHAPLHQPSSCDGGAYRMVCKRIHKSETEGGGGGGGERNSQLILLYFFVKLLSRDIMSIAITYLHRNSDCATDA